MRIKSFKFHKPTFHLGGNKYKPGDSYRYSVTFRDGKLRGTWRSGWREHDHKRYVFDSPSPSVRSVVGLLGPQTSARKVYDSTPGKAYQ